MKITLPPGYAVTTNKLIYHKLLLNTPELPYCYTLNQQSRDNRQYQVRTGKHYYTFTPAASNNTILVTGRSNSVFRVFTLTDLTKPSLPLIASVTRPSGHRSLHQLSSPDPLWTNWDGSESILFYVEVPANRCAAICAKRGWRDAVHDAIFYVTSRIQ